MQFNDTIKIGEFEHTFEYEHTHISCGVRQINNLPQLWWITKVLKKHTLKELKVAYKKTLDSLKECGAGGEDYAAFLILSNNNNNSKGNKILNSICQTTRWRINPNSGNKIKIYIY